MGKEWGDAVEDCKPGEFTFLAEFTWTYLNDEYARSRFNFWKKGLFDSNGIEPDSGINKLYIHAYYLVATRTFFIIGPVENEDKLKNFCKKVTGNSPNIQYKYHECFFPAP